METPAVPPAPRKRRWLRRLRIACIVYLIAVLLIWWGHVTDRLILFPSTAPVSTHDAERELLRLADGGDLELWKARSPGARGREPVAFILYFVGNADRADRWATFFAAQWGDTPVEAVGMNYPGFGGSTGPTRLAKIGPSALAAYDAVRARAGGRPILVQANSIGTTAALCVIARRDVAGATLQNPPPLRRLILQHHGWWNAWLLAVPAALAIPADLDSLANAQAAKCPAVFIVSEKDEVVPVAYQKMIFDRFAGENRLVDIAYASHNEGMDQPAWDRVAVESKWLWGRIFPEDKAAQRP